jgi:histidine ammonia-lyase
MIFQYVAASLVSENKVLSHPASVDSIPSSANQEDHVSMGAVAARKCKTVLENVAKVLAIEYLCACQALEFTEKKMSKRTKRAYDLLRSVVPPLKEDRMYASEIEFAVELIRSGNLAALFEGELEI